MSVDSGSIEKESSPTVEKPQSRKVLGATGLAHLFHDGATDMHYVLFALWQQQFGLSMAQIGLLKMLFSGAMSAFQIPSGELGRKYGERKVLIGGTLLLTVALLLYGTSETLIQLMILIVIGGLGASVQHPLSSSFITRFYPPQRARIALSTYNFFGDVGKGIIPSALSACLLVITWGTALQLIALLGFLVTLGLYVLLPADGKKTPQVATLAGKEATQQKQQASSCVKLPEPLRKRAFTALCVIGSIDNATRTGTLTFLPFLMAARGASATQIGFALTLIFIGGAFGKLVCGVLATKLGVIKTVAASEIITSAIVLGMTVAPLQVSWLLLVPLGIALNGTSSILYGSVAELARPHQQTRAFAIFYTASLGCGALMPLIYGLAGDAIGVKQTLIVVALLVLCILPLLIPVRSATKMTGHPPR
ncbi:MFS transporter [Kosakonia sp. H7A]|uniref:MFS transporter n=1 Tax=unclassified Kosakonia TaxID=2632876 RepID=UPI000D173820|nr:MULTISPECIES: MFS transporter [unclassified Kosakonia]NCF08231.1 MFS transporter [Kosakonia sp. MH5]PTA88466.1 MFS transporter [Kosakonia sp. H7A]